MEGKRPYPFFERWADRLPEPVTGRMLLALVPALVFSAAHYLAVGERFLSDWSWLLSLIIFLAGVFFFYGTRLVYQLLDRMAMLHPPQDDAHLLLAERVFTDRGFVLCGIAFGALDLLMGILFGIWYAEPAGQVTLGAGLFIGGFVCGFPVWGMRGLVALVRFLTVEQRLRIDHTAPDRCGGMLFLGSTILQSSMLFLIISVLIAVYFLKAPWVQAGQTAVRVVMLLWLAVPFLVSSILLLAPSADVNRLLVQYKNSEERKASGELAAIRKRLEASDLTSADRKALREDYEFHAKLRRELHEMSTWPFDSRSSLQYLGVFGANAFLAVDSVIKLLRRG